MTIRVGARALIIQGDSILLVEFNDEHGLHYNLPGGGTKEGETILDGLRREVREETSAAIEIGPLVFVTEYEPLSNRFWAGDVHALSLIFACKLAEGSQPRMPEEPDPYQSGVRWVPLDELESVELLPHITGHILTYARTGSITITFFQEPIDPERAGRYLEGGSF